MLKDVENGLKRYQIDKNKKGRVKVTISLFYVFFLMRAMCSCMKRIIINKSTFTRLTKSMLPFNLKSCFGDLLYLQT